MSAKSNRGSRRVLCWGLMAFVVMSLAHRPASADPIPIDFGQAITSSIESPDEEDTYTFSGLAPSDCPMQA